MADKHEKEIDKITGIETTGHEWDGLKELNNPTPRWWLIIFLFTIIWSVGYWVVYPAWPTFKEHTKGIKDWSSYKKLAAEQNEITNLRGEYLIQIKTKTLEEIQKDPKLYEFAVAGGRTVFRENCAACHGTGAEGGKGYPNLNDDDWLWGGALNDIYTTIKHGIRSEHEETRLSEMPAFGRDAILKKAEIEEVANYVLSLSGKTKANQNGAKLFADNCAACHSADGKGNRELGAPNLADALWLYGDTKEAVIQQVFAPRHGVMPTWEARLPDETIKQLTVYIHSLGGGE